MRDPDRPGSHVELPGRVVRFGPPGRPALAEGVGADQPIQLVPTGQVLAVTHLREVDHPGSPVAG